MKKYLQFKFYQVFKKFNQFFKIKINNKHEFKLKISNSHEIMRALTFESKEPEMIEWILDFKNLSKNQNFTFFDIGANVGIYSLFAASCYKNISILSFEPESTNFASLCINIQKNNFNNITPYQIALSDKNGFEKLHVGLVESGAGAAAVGSDYKDINASKNFKQGIYGTTLDDLVFNQNFEVPTFVKIDVDGFENQILEGAKQLLRNDNLKSIIIEYEFKDLNEKNNLIELMNKNGLKLKFVSDWVEFSFDNSEIRNFIFTRI